MAMALNNLFCNLIVKPVYLPTAIPPTVASNPAKTLSPVYNENWR